MAESCAVWLSGKQTAVVMEAGQIGAVKANGSKSCLAEVSPLIQRLSARPRRLMSSTLMDADVPGFIGLGRRLFRVLSRLSAKGDECPEPNANGRRHVTSWFLPVGLRLDRGCHGMKKPRISLHWHSKRVSDLLGDWLVDFIDFI